MKLTQLLKENEERPLSNEVKRHFLEIVSTYNKYQESMDRKSDITQVAETLGGITEAARTLAIKEGDDWFDKHTVKRNMSELDKLGKQFDKVALEARSLDQRMAGLYEDMGHILSRYYKIGEITEDQMKQRLGISESKELSINEDAPSEIFADSLLKQIGPFIRKSKFKVNGYSMFETSKEYVISSKPKGIEIHVSKKLDSILESKDGGCGCGCGGGCSDSVNEETITEQPVMVSKRTENGNIVTTLKEVSDLNEEEIKLYEFGLKVEKVLMSEKNCPTDAGKWSASKAAAKKKFDVYPSAYANGWAAKNYKSKGGGWRKCKG
jgi:hypothetical protein